MRKMVLSNDGLLYDTTFETIRIGRIFLEKGETTETLNGKVYKLVAEILGDDVEYTLQHNLEVK